MSGNEPSELLKRGRDLALKMADFAKDNGYSIAEAGVAVTMLGDALAKIAIFGIIFGDMADEMLDAAMENEVEKLMEEAEGVLRDEH